MIAPFLIELDQFLEFRFEIVDGLTLPLSAPLIARALIGGSIFGLLRLGFFGGFRGIGRVILGLAQVWFLEFGFLGGGFLEDRVLLELGLDQCFEFEGRRLEEGE